jgi:hypothetical protein
VATKSADSSDGAKYQLHRANCMMASEKSAGEKHKTREQASTRGHQAEDASLKTRGHGKAAPRIAIRVPTCPIEQPTQIRTSFRDTLRNDGVIDPDHPITGSFNTHEKFCIFTSGGVEAAIEPEASGY